MLSIENSLSLKGQHHCCSSSMEPTHADFLSSREANTDELEVARQKLELYGRRGTDDLHRLASKDFIKQLANSSQDACLHWILIEYYRVHFNDLCTALALLEHARAQGHHEDPLYLDILEKMHYETRIKISPDHLRTRLDDLLRRAPESPAFAPQLDRFCTNLPADAARMMRAIGVEDACAIMQRGALDRVDNPAAAIRTRMFDAHSRGSAEYAELQRMFAKLRNMQLAVMYESMSKRDLEDELAGRGVTIGRQGPGRNIDKLLQKVMESDEVYCKSGLLDNYGTIFGEEQAAIDLFKVKPKQKEALGRAVFKLMRTIDAKERGRQLYAMQQSFQTLSAAHQRAFWVIVDLSDGTRSKTQWRLRSEHLFKQVCEYSVAELQEVARALKLKTLRHPVEADWRRAVQLFIDRRQKLMESVREAEETPRASGSFFKRDAWAPSLKEKYANMSLERLEAEFDGRCLTRHAIKIDAEGKQRRQPLIHGVPGTRALQLRARLQRSDEAFSEHCPEDGYSELSNVQLRCLMAAVGISQGDQTQPSMMNNINAFRNQQMETHFETHVDDSDGAAHVAQDRSTKRRRVHG